MSLSMYEGETLKAYSDRYREMYNEMDGNFDDVAISTFKSGLPTEHGLRKSLTASLSPMYVSLWTELTNTREWKKTSCKGKERRRLSLKR